ncbi:MAG: EAL domain-containing protein [bacterium]|nr:EAL domain-containing protein [bacterium]
MSRKKDIQPDKKTSSLKSDILKYRNSLYDSILDIPSYPMVIDEIRKTLDISKVCGLVFLSIANSSKFEYTYGWEAFDEVLKFVADSLKEYLDKSKTHSPMLTIRNIRNDEFIIFFFENAKEHDLTIDLLNEKIFEIERFLLQKIKANQPMSYKYSINFNLGYSILSMNPLVRFERMLNNSIRDAYLMAHYREQNLDFKMKSELHRIIAESQIKTAFQPIFDLKTMKLLGYEALTRGPENSIFADPETMFSFALHSDLITELDRICRNNALLMSKQMKNKTKLFLNTEVQTIYTPDFIEGKILDILDSHNLNPKDIVIEITERSAIENYQKFTEILKILKSLQFNIALDDAGVGYASLQTITEINPRYLKIDHSLVKNINKDLIRRHLIQTLVDFSEKTDILLIAEGIEDEDELEVLREIGIHYGQGFYLGKPDFNLI